MSEHYLTHRFGVFFFTGGYIPNLLDTHFQKVSGLSYTVETTPFYQGGENVDSYSLPEKITHPNLILERGLVVGSPLNIEFNITFSSFKFYPSNVVVILLDGEASPVSAWLFMKAYPVKWVVSDMDANSGKVVIDTMELAYSQFQILRI